MHGFLELVQVWKPALYAIILVGMIFEGEFFLFTAIFFAHQGIIDMPLVLVCAAIGLVIGDFSWYFAGRYWVEKIPFLEKILHKVTGVFDKHLRRRPFSTIFISKFAYGIHRAVVLRAGQRRIPLKKYTRIILFSDVIWFAIVTGLAITLSTSLGPVRHYLHFAEVIMLLVILAFIFSERIIAFVTELFMGDDE